LFLLIREEVPVNISDDKRAVGLGFESEMPVDVHAMPKTGAFQDTGVRSTGRTAKEHRGLEKGAADVWDVIEV
jgi:hypothetical protein